MSRLSRGFTGLTGNTCIASHQVDRTTLSTCPHLPEKNAGGLLENFRRQGQLLVDCWSCDRYCCSTHRASRGLKPMLFALKLPKIYQLIAGVQG